MSMHTTFSLTEVHISICNPYNQLQLLENNFSDFPLSPVDRDNDILQKIKNVMVEKLSSSGVKLSFSKNVCMCVCVCVCVCVSQSCPTLCDLMDCSLPGSSVTEFSRQEYWSGLPFPSPGDLPDPGMEPRSLALQADSLLSEPPGKLNKKNMV